MSDGHDPYAVLAPRVSKRKPIPAAYRGAAWTDPGGTEGRDYIDANGPPIVAQPVTVEVEQPTPEPVRRADMSVRAVDMILPGEEHRK